MMIQLSPREIEIAKYLVNGYTAREIANELKISIRTIHAHRCNMKKKIQYRTSVELGTWLTSFFNKRGDKHD